ncbi:MAG TPA: hypothetical protein VFG84_02990 [Gemmatimonadaceae bacterium]|nr:hypothetical protein [Gemmatimonadaceae bacterium]
MRVQPTDESGSGSRVDYRWDRDTDILSAQVRRMAVVSDGGTGAMEIEGRDGSWLVLDVESGTIRGVEIAVWPRVLRRRSLTPPDSVCDARVQIGGDANGDVLALEMNTFVHAESDEHETTLHFRLGRRRPSRTVRIASEILLDIDDTERLAGVWLLRVPPFPEDES